MFIINDLDFLPIVCEGCKDVFCGEHFQASRHNCPNENDNQNKVPTCPLCSQPIAKKPAESADEVVSRHIDQNCEIKRERVFSKKCNVPGCKQKEIMSLVCPDCAINHCLKHRHPKDHNCTGPRAPITPVDGKNTKTIGSFNQFARRSVGMFQNVRSVVSNNLNLTHNSSNTFLPIQNDRTNTVDATTRLQGDLTEEEAMQLAISQSLMERTRNQGSSSNSCTID